MIPNKDVHSDNGSDFDTDTYMVPDKVEQIFADLQDVLDTNNIGLSALSKKTDIPLRSLQHWKNGDREIPEWLPKMINLWIKNN